MCTVCGRYGQVGSRPLRKECEGQATAHGLRVLLRIAERPPRPPYGLASWPDGTPAERGCRRSPKKARASKGLNLRNRVSRTKKPTACRAEGPGETGCKASKRPASPRSAQAAANAQPPASKSRGRRSLAQQPAASISVVRPGEARGARALLEAGRNALRASSASGATPAAHADPAPEPTGGPAQASSAAQRFEALRARIRAKEAAALSQQG